MWAEFEIWEIVSSFLEGVTELRRVEDMKEPCLIIQGLLQKHLLGSSLAPKWPILVHFCGMDHQKSFFLLILAPFLWEAVEVSQYIFFWKLDDETQISEPPEPAMHHNSTRLLVFLPLRADLLRTLHYGTPCKYVSYFTSLSPCLTNYHMTEIRNTQSA